MTTRRLRCAALLLLGGLTAGCSEPRIATREERIERTQQALSAMLVNDVASAEAERFVDLCDEDPANMGKFGSVTDPDGIELFDSIEEAERVRGGGVGIPVSELACTASGYAKLQSLWNI